MNPASPSPSVPSVISSLRGIRTPRSRFSFQNKTEKKNDIFPFTTLPQSNTVTKPDKTSYQFLMACYSLLPYIKLHPIVRYHYLNYQDNISCKQFETCLPATAVQRALKHHVTCQVPLKATHTLISQPGTQAKNKTLPPLLHCANGSEQ